MNVQVENLLIDYDGTLVDSEIVHREIWLDLLEQHGKPREIKDEDFLGLSASVIAQRLFEPDLASKVLETFEKEELSRDYEWMPGAEAFIKAQHAAGKKLAIVTNSRRAKVTQFLQKQGVSDVFDIIITCDDVQNRKPHPEVYELALKRLGGNADNSVAIEDSVIGLCSAREAGLRYMLVQPQDGYDLNTWSSLLQETISLSPENFDLAYRKAQILWDFHRVKDVVEPCDVIVGLGSYDIEVARKCAKMLQDGVAGHVIFTGKEGNWTTGKSAQTEAQLFADAAIDMGIAFDQIHLEEKATNIGQNVLFSKAIMLSHGWQSAVFVTKPQTTLRTRLALEVQAPEINKASKITSPDYPDMDHFLAKFGHTQLLNEMVGDLERIIKYPKKGYQAPTNIPDEVMEAYDTLQQLGFIHHMM